MAVKTDLIGVKHSEEMLSLEELNSIDRTVKQLSEMSLIQNNVLSEMLTSHHPVMTRWLKRFIILNQQQMSSLVEVNQFMNKLWRHILEEK